MFENVGSGEILLILIVILIFFGPKKIPELAQSLGKGMRKFNDAKAGFESQVKTVMKEPLEALTSAKEGFETKLREAAEPLHAELKIPAPQFPAGAPPILAQSAESLPRGAAEIQPVVDPPATPTTEIPAKEA